MSEAHNGALRLRVDRIEAVTPEINRYTFSAEDGSWLPPFSGGSHVRVLIPYEGETRRNAYSLMSSPYDTSKYQIAVRRIDEGKRGSIAMHRDVREGDVGSVYAVGSEEGGHEAGIRPGRVASRDRGSMGNAPMDYLLQAVVVIVFTFFRGASHG